MNFELGVCARVTTFDETDFHGGNFRRVGREGEKGWFGTIPSYFSRGSIVFFFFSRRTFRIHLGVLIFNEKGHKEVLSIRLYTSL